MRPAFRRLGVMAAVLALSACGGGGDDEGGSPPQAGTAEGAYAGSLTGVPSNYFESVVLENGEFYSVYYTVIGGGAIMDGFIHGSGTSSNGAFTSVDPRDYAVIGTVTPVTVDGTYRAGASVQGRMTYAQAGLGPATYSGTAAAIAPYDYQAPAQLASVVGVWELTTPDGESITATVQANGAMTSVSNGCVSTGTVSPRASGKNVFDVSLTAGQAPCLVPGAAMRGIGLSSSITVAGTTQQKLLVALVAADRSFGQLSFGFR